MSAVAAVPSVAAVAAVPSVAAVAAVAGCWAPSSDADVGDPKEASQTIVITETSATEEAILHHILAVDPDSLFTVGSSLSALGMKLVAGESTTQERLFSYYLGITAFGVFCRRWWLVGPADPLACAACREVFVPEFIPDPVADASDRSAPRGACRELIIFWLLGSGRIAAGVLWNDRGSGHDGLISMPRRFVMLSRYIGQLLDL
jgi:hypothetical protein